MTFVSEWSLKLEVLMGFSVLAIGLGEDSLVMDCNCDFRYSPRRLWASSCGSPRVSVLFIVIPKFLLFDFS